MHGMHVMRASKAARLLPKTCKSVPRWIEVGRDQRPWTEVVDVVRRRVSESGRCMVRENVMKRKEKDGAGKTRRARR